MEEADLYHLRNIFAPDEAKRREAFRKEGGRLIHYTSAANAISILEKNEIWMRNVRCMNDYMEVEHGLQLMQSSLRPPVNSDAEKGLRAVFSALGGPESEIVRNAVSVFDQNLALFKNHTYVVCLSEHDPVKESVYGRLSMWRSYTSSQVGVGLVMNPAPFYLIAPKFGAFSSAVYYYDEQQIGDMFREVAENIDRENSYIRSLPPKDVTGILLALLRTLAMCTKHPGFLEEREWRVMHTQGWDPRGALTVNVECPNGVPQPVFKIPLRDHLESGMTGITVPRLLEQVIIGPTQFPQVVRDALVIKLKAAGVANPERIVTFSNIPIRT